ncbi:MAG: ribonuclease J [Erysipelotrichaceae bacterium]|nr:ribonuclease J [Erysipelotrichaceae bacterium]
MSKIRIVALGGLDESGKNLYCIEIGDKIIVVNAGLKFPDENQFGIEYIVPDYSYLVENKDRILGVVITHAHDDMMNGLPQLLRQIDLDVYGPEMCYRVLKHNMTAEEYSKVKFHVMPRYGETDIHGIMITSFGLTHATADAIGISIDTPDGQIVICEQFVIDFDMNDKGFDCDISAIAEIGKKGVLALLMESSYADKDTFTAPKHRISNLIRSSFEDAKGRIIITVYSQNYFRVKEIIALAKEFKRSVFFYNEHLRQRITDLENMGYYTMPRGLEISRENFSNDIENVVVIVNGSGQNIFTLMNRIATGEDTIIELNENDTVIIASPVVNGLEKKASKMEDELYRDNVNIVKLDSKEVLSMHPGAEDMKMILNLVKPKYFVPVMGEYLNFVQAGNLALQLGLTPDRVIILDNGQVASINDGTLVSCSDFVDVGDTMVGDDNDKSITSFVLRDRETLSTDGVIIIGLAINYKTKEIIAGPDIQSRGVIYVKDSEYVIKNVGKMAVDLIEERVAEGNYENMAVRSELREMVSRYVLRETGKRPMILPALIEINLPG